MCAVPIRFDLELLATRSMARYSMTRYPGTLLYMLTSFVQCFQLYLKVSGTLLGHRSASTVKTGVAALSTALSYASAFGAAQDESYASESLGVCCVLLIHSLRLGTYMFSNVLKTCVVP